MVVNGISFSSQINNAEHIYKNSTKLQSTITESTPDNQPAQNIQQAPLAALQAYTLPFNSMKEPFEQEFRLPGNRSLDIEISNRYSPMMQSVINNFSQRAGKTGQFLNWVDLPKKQLEKNTQGVSHVDEIYAQSIEFKKRENGKERPLVVLGIGGSKHPTEFLLNLSGVDKNKVLFYSDIDPISFNNFLKDSGNNIQDLNFLVVSKSGKTFETSDSFKRFEDKLTESYKQQGLSDEDSEKKAQEHFAIATNTTASLGNLRSKIGSENGADNSYIKELYVHDDISGAYSMFDDAGIFALAYAGVDKNTTERILDSAAKTSEKLLQYNDLKSNSAAKSAMMNIYSRDNGYKTTMQQLFGKVFETGGENWYKQLYLETIKDFDYMAGKAPDSMHYASDGHYTNKNRNTYNTVMTIMNPGISNNYKKYTSAIADTYNETTPLTIEKLDVEGNRIKPESIGQYVQSKYFEAVYTGIMKRAISGDITPNTVVLPEVTQPSVEAYKSKFKIGSFYELNPGQG